MKNVSVLLITTIVILAACNPTTPEDKDSAIQTAITQTQAAEDLIQTLAAQTVVASIPTVTLTPTETLTPTPTLTPEPPPSVTLIQNPLQAGG